MGLQFLDLVFRLERDFGIKLNREKVLKLSENNDAKDILVGDLFELVRSEGVHRGVLDDEMDAEFLWFMFQQNISHAFGVELDEVTKDRWLRRDLGG